MSGPKSGPGSVSPGGSERGRATAETFTPVRKVVTLRATPEQAFRRFTHEIATWWPLAKLSVGENQSETVTLAGRVGGKIVERIRDGREAEWGTVTAWDPPHRVAFTWHPGAEPSTAQDVEVRFTPVAGGTRVELEHKSFERMGPNARQARRGYPLGWAWVLGLYTERRGLGMALISGLVAVATGLDRKRAQRAARKPASNPPAPAS